MEHLFLYGILQFHSSALSVFIITCIKYFFHNFDDPEMHSSMLFGEKLQLPLLKNVHSVHIYVYSLNYLVSTFSNLLNFN